MSDTTVAKPTKLTPAMRGVLARMAALSDAVLENDFRTGWHFVRTITPDASRTWPHREWLGFAPTLTVEALARHGLIEIKVPRLTPGLYAVTAYLTDAGRAAASPIGAPEHGQPETVRARSSG